MRKLIPAAAYLLLVTLLGFFLMPGHTYLQSDTQIYAPILERLHDRTLLARDPVATRPHVAFTVYDEVAVFLRRLTGAELQTVLVAQQLLYRFLGTLGVYLTATAVGMAPPAAVLTSAIFGLGATIVGPAVLTLEYEPVPRGFAILLILLAIGLAAHGRDFAAGAAASLAFLYHPPTTAPFWVVYFALTLWPSETKTMARRITGLAPLMAAVVVLFVFSRMQPGAPGAQDFFSRISPEHEQIQRLRASYNWVSTWIGVWLWQYLALSAVAALALWRVFRRLPEDLRWLLCGLPVTGLLSVPISYIFLEGMKWSLIPQYQPARAVLFVTATAVLAAVLAAYHEAEANRPWLSFLWLLPAYAVPVAPRLQDAFLVPRKLAVTALAAALSALAFWAVAQRRRWAPAPLALAAVLPFYLIPGWAGTVNYPSLHKPDLDSLSTWARLETQPDSVFLFPDAGRDLSPGIFRARAKRALYVDWKSGGQVNYHRAFAEEWWERWNAVVVPGFRIPKIREYFEREIDFIVLKPQNRIPGVVPAYSNPSYVVYAVPELLGLLRFQ
jgi:hypothetical protein